ncbi:hypothetical protein D3C81_971450 [compost metagenome]
MIGDLGQLHAVRGRVGDDVLHRLELGHVVARLVRHGQAGVVRRQPARLVAGDGPRDGALAPVVRGQGQVPVAEHVVQAREVVERGIRGGQHIAPLVAEHVLLEVVGLARARDELPHAGRLGRGFRLRIERALHERQQGQLRGHLAPLQLFHDVVQVAARPPHHPLHIVRACRVPLGAVIDQRALEVLHGKATADAVPDIVRRAAQPVEADLVHIDHGGAAERAGASGAVERVERVLGRTGFEGGRRAGHLAGGRGGRAGAGCNQRRTRNYRQKSTKLHEFL